MDTALDRKWRHLQAILGSMKRVVVAYSGGVDSATLLQAAVTVLGPENVLAVLSTSASVPRREVEAAMALARRIGAPLTTMETAELSNPLYVVNDAHRCYFCKATLFADCVALAERNGFSQVLYGAILDDLGDVRPGMRAARELKVRGPLAEAQFTKSDVRALAREFGLAVWDKPASACLASRVAHGVAVTAASLSRVERAEDFLHDLGFRQVRVRHHSDEMARIEVDPGEMVHAAERAQEIHAFLEGLGYRFITLDLGGYRSGSLNPVPASERSPA